jgi:hypothetical protein
VCACGVESARAQVMLTADRSGVASLIVPVLLSGTYKGTKHQLPPATQRELESVFRLVRGALLELAQVRTQRTLVRDEVAIIALARAITVIIIHKKDDSIIWL